MTKKGTSNEKQGTCALCGNCTVLMKSHSVPKFTAEWLKRTSGTGYLREVGQPNLRKQDFRTFRLLCAACEGIFSQWEKRFAEDIFIPYQDKGKKAFIYDDWLLRFAISLAWRTITLTAGEFHQDEPNLSPHVDAALACWKAFLLGEIDDPGPYAHHLLFLDMIATSSTMNVPEYAHWYMLRSVDATIAFTSKEVYAYTKLPGLVFWSGIHPAQPEGWQNTQIWRLGVAEAFDQKVGSNGFAEFLFDRVKSVSQAQVSERQQDQMLQTALKDPERFQKSRSTQVFLTEQFWKEWQGHS